MGEVSASPTARVREPGVEVSSPAAAERVRRPRWWLAPLGIFAVSRVVSTGLWLAVIALARPGSRIGQHSSLVHAMAVWDGQWFQLVARSGYPAHLPVSEGGLVQTSAWAFLPAYPVLANVLALGRAAAWPAAAELLSTGFGFLSAVLLALLLRPHVGDGGARRAVWLFALSPVAFILQAAYAESMGMFLMLAALCLLDRQRYLSACVPTLVLAFTRPSVQAFAIAVALHLAVRWWSDHRAGVPPRRTAVAGGVVLLLVASVSGFLWSWIAGAVTGNPNAYVQTELAWRLGWMGPGKFVPVVPWFFSADFWFGSDGPLVFGALVALFTLLLLSRSLRRCGLVVWAWVLSWGVYLLGVFFPQSSTFRLLLPFAPAGGVLGAVRSRVLVVGVLVVNVALQAVWLYFSFGGWQYFWSVP